MQVESDNSQSGSYASNEDQCMPRLYSIRQSTKFQRQVDSRIRELEQQTHITGSVGKIKSKIGGNAEVIVKHRVAWPHEAILGVQQDLGCHMTS